ncbi:DUF3857 and transglutaminase domain-containing protein [Spirosoma sp. BT702]|uniref:DUF3857 and transglutaminase domain-containing protein n=1 Tax=Spirosoma profusum TaxID=2771354 RepID=A0A926XWZ0_9BACT|nr:DUF3857 domain-containing protein [Spirosoma profusum]MBD2699392.1 DUF3857 and transglutaminase domain-containing protein [Spirosoma profusum]
MKYSFWILLLTGQVAWAQNEYKASAIEASLKENAHSVIRRYETIFTVKSPGEATERTHTVITVLDKEADSQAQKMVYYDKFSKITSFEGALYDAEGKLIKRLKKSDIEDYSTYADYNLFDDQRVKAASFPKQPTYPYTVEFLIETTERNLMFYPTWMPQHQQNVAVEQSTYTVHMPAGLALRYKEMNLPTPGVVTDSPEGGKTYTWKLANLPAVEFEPLSPPASEILPVVYTAPTEFDVQNHKGKLTSWSDVSRFYHALNDGRDIIPDALKQRVLELTKQETTTAGKVRSLYKFLQEHTRYVSIQLGIGGWQTIEAEKVAMHKYGDCKALTNYTLALLKAAGIKSFPALVRAGDDEPDLLVDFPSFQFNHVILCVPDGRDTLFLECTSGHGPAGYMSDFTGNRHVLLILPDGGRLTQTPTYRPTDNRQQRRITVNLTDQGDADANVRTYYSGLQQDAYASVMQRLNRDDQRSWLLKRIRIPAFELNSFAYNEQPGTLPAVTETLALTARRWATVSGTRLFLPLNLLSALSPAEPLTQPRRAMVNLDASYAYEDSDTVVYQLPKGYVPEYRIEPISIDSKFGRYKSELAVNGDRVTYVRHIQMQGGRFPATAYTEWVDFRKKVAKADRTQLVFIKAN